MEGSLVSSMDLLWTNTEGNFTAGTQKISLDLTKYNGIIIQFIGYIGWVNKWHFYIPKNSNMKCSVSVEQDSTTQGGAWWRVVDVDTTFVNIGYALDSASSARERHIPNKIFGI